MEILELSHRKRGKDNVFALQFREHYVGMCDFREKWSRLNLGPVRRGADRTVYGYGRILSHQVRLRAVP
jgi:hypothetical protein